MTTQTVDESVETPEALANPYEMEFVSADEVPDAPRTREVNTARFEVAKEILNQAPAGNWLKVKTFDNPLSAAQVSSQINNSKHKVFDGETYEARYDKTEDVKDEEGNVTQRGTSTLYVARKA